MANNTPTPQPSATDPNAAAPTTPQVPGPDPEPNFDPAPTPTILRDAAASHLNADLSQFENDAVFLDELTKLWNHANNAPPADEIDRLRKLEPVATQYLQHAGEFQEFLAQRNPATPAPPQPTTTTPPTQPVADPNTQSKWAPPQISDATQRLISSGMLIEDPTTGLYRVRPDEDPSVAANLAASFSAFAKEANDAINWRRTAGDRLLSDPIGVLNEAGLEDRLTAREKEMRDHYDQRIAQLESTIQRMTQPQEEQREQALLSKMFATNAVGQLDFDQPTQLGTLYRQTAQTQADLLKRYNPQMSEEELKAAAHHAGLEAVERHETIFASAPSDDGNATTGDPNAPTGAVNAQPTGGGGTTASQTRDANQQTFLDRARGSGQAAPPAEPRPATVATAAAREDPHDNLDEDQLWEQEVAPALGAAG